MKLEQLHRDQPLASIHQVWQTDEHQGKTPGRWYNKAAKESSPYRWGKGPFNGKADGWSEHQLSK